MPEPIATHIVNDTTIRYGVERGLAERQDFVPTAELADAEVIIAGAPLEVTAEIRDRVSSGACLLLTSPGAWTTAELASLPDAGATKIIPALLNRFHSAAQRAKQSLNSGGIGLPWSIVGERSTPCTRPGALADDLVDAVDLVRFLTGLQPVRVSSWGTADERSGHGLLKAEFERGLVSTLSAARLDTAGDGNGHHHYRIMGNEGILMLEMSLPALTIAGPEHHRIQPFGIDPVDVLLDHVAAVARDRANPSATVDDLAAALSAIETKE